MPHLDPYRPGPSPGYTPAPLPGVHIQEVADFALADLRKRARTAMIVSLLTIIIGNLVGAIAGACFAGAAMTKDKTDVAGAQRLLTLAWVSIPAGFLVSAVGFALTH